MNGSKRRLTLAHGITIVPIETPTLGDRSYVVHDGQVAFVVDPAARHRPRPAGP